MLENKKKVLTLTVILAVAFIVAATALSGCATTEFYTVESTYAKAQELGYTGTLDEFILMISGKDGVDGTKIISFEKTASNGGIDTYTIGYSDGTSHSFTVKNGIDGAAVAQGDSAFEVWAALPENQGKTIYDFIEAISGNDGENGSSITAVETATTYALGSSLSVVANFEKNGYTSASAGSAIIYEDDAANNTLYLITNYHVVYCDKITVSMGYFSSQSIAVDDTSKDIKVYFYGMPYFTDSKGNMTGGITAKYMGGSYTNDVAILTLTGDSYTQYINYREKCGKVSSSPDADYFIRPVTKSTKIASVGDTAIAIGNPEGTGISATSGIVNVESENITLALSSTKTINTRVMRIDTAVNSGNSGGGLFTSDGSWIGIVNAKTTANTIENIAYALPHEMVSAIADNIIRGYKAQLSDGDASNDNLAVSAKMPTLGITTKIADRYATIVDGKAAIIDQSTVDEITDGDYLAAALIAADDPNAIKVGDMLISAKIGGITYNLQRLHTLKELLYKVDSAQVIELNITRNNVNQTLLINITADDILAVA